MPCRDDRNDCYENPETRRRLDKVTRLLCGLCRKITKRGFMTRIEFIDDNEELKIWWEEHQEADLRRIERENLQKQKEKRKKEALAKLNLEDRKILGLN